MQVEGADQRPITVTVEASSAMGGTMERLTPSDVRNIAFRKPPVGKRGYDERDVDEFLARVESTLTDTCTEIASLKAQLGEGDDVRR